MLLHEGIAYCGNAAEDRFGDAGGRAGEWADEIYERVGALGALVQALEAKRHGACLRMCRGGA